MNLTTTLWTTPLNNNRWDMKAKDALRNNLMMCALNVSYAKESSAHITMHCNEEAYQYLEKFGYDDVFIDLNDLNIKKTSSTVMWAAGKFISLSKEPIGTIHIDNDVFIKSPKCIEAMKFDDYDFICQNIEVCNYAEKEIFRELIPTVNMDVDYACCVGIVGFNNKELRDNYVNHYMYYVDNLQYDKKDDNKVNADLILEQIYLYNQLDKYSCKFLIGDARVDNMHQMQKKAVDIKFEHILGPSKYIPYVLNKMYNELNKRNPKLYNLITNI